MWKSGGESAEESNRAALLLNQLQTHNAEQHPCRHRMVLSLMEIMQVRLPSIEAWQAVTQACAEAIIACYKDRCTIAEHLMQVNNLVKILQQCISNRKAVP